MNREIKFRGQRTDTKEFVYGYYRKNTFFDLFGDIPKEVYTKHFIGSFDNIKKFDGLFEQVEVIPDSVGQFTGLLDKNGKEIYEGDVLQGDNSVIYSVIFCDGSFDLVVEKFYLGDNSKSAKDRFPYPQPMCYFVFTSIEIIGNIYENPKLIN
jgi:uncharacterized phage protein (TIGR01671 family)